MCQKWQKVNTEAVAKCTFRVSCDNRAPLTLFFIFFAKVGESCSNRWIFLHFYSGEQTFVLISPHKWTLGWGGKLFSALWKAEPSPVFGLISSGREKRQRSPMAESGRGVRTRAAGLSIHFTTSPYVQRMNYRCPHASSEEVDAVLTSRWRLRTKVNRVRKTIINILLLRDCHPCGYSIFFHACRDGRFYDASAPWVCGPERFRDVLSHQSGTSSLTCVTFSVTLWVLSLTFGAMMAVSDVGGEWVFFSVASEKFSAIRGILLMVLYLLMLESEVEPSRLDLTWLKGPGRAGETQKDGFASWIVKRHVGFGCGTMAGVKISKSIKCQVVPSCTTTTMTTTATTIILFVLLFWYCFDNNIVLMQLMYQM